jgi:hypothetical protein
MKLHLVRRARSPRNGYTLVELSISAIVMTVL